MRETLPYPIPARRPYSQTITIPDGYVGSLTFSTNDLENGLDPLSLFEFKLAKNRYSAEAACAR